VLLTSYLAGITGFCLVKSVLDRNRSKKIMFKNVVAASKPADPETNSLPPNSLFSLPIWVFGYENTLVALAAIHLASVGIAQMCNFGQIATVTISLFAPACLILLL
jgi:hypothetical protein